MEIITLYYVAYFALVLIGQSFSMYGQFKPLPFKSLSQWDGLKMALPYAWVDWIFMTGAGYIDSLYNLTTPNQKMLTIVVVQSSLVILIDKYYFQNKILVSNIVGIMFMITGFYISIYTVISSMKKSENKNKNKDKELNKI